MNVDRTRRRALTPILAALVVTRALVGPGGSGQGEDPFAANIRPTQAKTPEEQRKMFHLPPGFKIELFASEPDILKPVNMAFDARGRLWVSCTTEYPIAAPPTRRAKDRICILEDTQGKGRADKITVFADGLNIPIGLYPYKNGVIAFGIPNISYFEDTASAGKAERGRVLYGPFDASRDTHGMNNGFRRGFDGWIYANHGWANHSKVRGPDGNVVDLQGGNTYRFRADGARIEHFTWGQVNPFGMTFDANGDLFNSDCHTRPFMLLLRNGNYDSFGRPHNGLGYVPNIMEHGHGSTAIAGAVQYTGNHFPPEYRGNLFVGNVMTCRVNRDRIRYHGSSVEAVEQPDFLSCDDPWFRPVDMQIGPDGALYIADFYNKIIGHVEVPLDHPGRDRFRGRIWRVTYVGTQEKPAVFDPVVNLRTAGTDALIASLAHPNLGVRMRATDELTDRVGKEAIGALRQAAAGRAAATVKVHAAWALFRLGAITPQEISQLARAEDHLARIHAMRILSEMPAWQAPLADRALAGLGDAEALVRRAAVDALGHRPRPEFVTPLLKLWHRTPPADKHLRHALRLSLLEIIKVEGALAQWRKETVKSADADLMAGIALALPTKDSAAFLIHYLKLFRPEAGLAGSILIHVSRHLPEDTDPAELAELGQRSAADNIDLQLDLLLAIHGGLQQRGVPDPPAVRTWAGGLARRLLDSIDLKSQASWSARLLDGRPSRPWQVEKRVSVDGVTAPFLSSLPLGEGYTGKLRSAEFVLPAKFSFFICGHLGDPGKAPVAESRVRLRLAGSDEVLHEVAPPRHDCARAVHWDLGRHAGRRGYLEATDLINAPAYAWLAIGRFDPPLLKVPAAPEVAARRLRSAALLARVMSLRDLQASLKTIVETAGADLETRVEAARALQSFHPNNAVAALVECAADASLSDHLRQAILAAAANPGFRQQKELLNEVVRSIPSRLQVVLAAKLAESKDGGELLLRAVAAGGMSAQCLRETVVQDKLKAAKIANVAQRIRLLTQALPPLERELQKLIDARRAGYARAAPSIQRGREMFAKHCQACHQIAGQGTIIAPQLDGIGERGLERVLEDILDPNRNIDPAFYTTVFNLKDGRVVSGLFRRQEGKTIVLADNTGKEITLAEDQIEDKHTTKSSLMPSNFGSALTEPELYDLVSFLLSQRTRPSQTKPRAGRER